MGGEAIISLVVLLILGVFVALLVLPIVALVRSRQITELAHRVQKLEAAMRWLEAARAAEEGGPEQPASAPAASVTEPVAPAAIPEVLPATRAPAVREATPAAPADAARIESWIGRSGLGWAAVVLLLLATAFFLKYAFDNEWIGPLGRVSLGLIAGLALCMAGWRYHRRGWRLFSQMLTAGGVVLLYLATFAAFGYYRLLPRDQAALFLVLLVAETAALAVLYNAPAIALMAVLGGLLNPVLLSTGIDQYRSLFLYLLVLNAGVVALAAVRSWYAVGTTALLGTQCLFWAWYGEHYHPQKLSAAFGFQVVLFALHFIYPLRQQPRLVGTRPGQRLRWADVEDLIRLVLNPFLFALAGYILLDEQYHIWMGTLAVGMAALYTARAWLVLRRRPEDVWHIAVATAVGLAFLAMVFPLQAEAGWIGLGWAVLGLVLWWFGLRIEADALRAFGAFWLVLAVGRLLLVDMPWRGRTPFVPVFNKYALPALGIAVCLVGAALISRRFHRVRGKLERTVQVGAGLAGVALIWLVLSVDTYQYFTAQIGRSRWDADTLVWQAQVGLSVLWAVYAAAVLTVGFRLSSQPLRLAALGLFGLTMAKVVLVDLAGLSGFYRVTTFFVLSLMMGAAAWGYQRIDAPRRETDPLPPDTREATHETV